MIVIKRPDGLPKGPVWYVPNIDGNRMDLENPSRVKIRILNGRQFGRVQANVIASGRMDAGEVNLEAIRQAVVELEGPWEIENIHTGEIMRPTDGRSLADALERTEVLGGQLVLMDIGAACQSMSLLQAGELGNLRRQQTSFTESGPNLTSGLVPAAGTQEIGAQTSEATECEKPGDAT